MNNIDEIKTRPTAEVHGRPGIRERAEGQEQVEQTKGNSKSAYLASMIVIFTAILLTSLMRVIIINIHF